MEDWELREDRQQYVVKGNDLIRKTRYNLTTQQQKIVLFCVSKIRPNDTPDMWYEFEIEELRAVLGIKRDSNGYYYKDLKQDIKALTERQWCEIGDEEMTLSWIGDAKVKKRDGTISIKFHEGMTPFLFQLKREYTQYQLKKILAFKCKYTIRLYEYLRSYMPQTYIDEGLKQSVYVTVEKLRSMLTLSDGTEKPLYPVWGEFKRCVLDKAVNEINAYSDELTVSYTTERKGHSVEKINFLIMPAKCKQQMEAHRRTRERNKLLSNLP